MKAWCKAAALAALLAVGFCVFSLLRPRETFTGERIKTPDSYTLNIERMTGTDRHTPELHAGDALSVQFETEAGALYMTILAPDGAVLYSGSGTEAPSFTLAIPQDGVYPISVEARRARGEISIRPAQDVG